MKNALYFILLCILFSLLACHKIKDDNQPFVPADFNIDLNEDGNPDFAIEYLDIEVNTAGGRAIIAQIKPFNNNEILVNEAAPILFLEFLDDIQPEVTFPLIWVNSEWSLALARLELKPNREWPQEWTISHVEDQAFYYLGFKLNDDNKVGWIKLEIDKSNGLIRVIEFEFL